MWNARGMVKTYNKLVRDRIPEIIEGEGRAVKTRIAKDDAEYAAYLQKKVLEEAEEMVSAADADNLREEIADLEEILDALIRVSGSSREEVLAIRAEKNKKRGAFEKRIILEEVE